MPAYMFKKICTALGVPDHIKATDKLAAVKEILAVDLEYNILQHPKVRPIIADEAIPVHVVLTHNYKPVGSWDTIPLSNTQIDQTLMQWERGFPDFSNIEINMINFAEYGGTLQQLTDNIDTVAKNQPLPITMHETRHSKTIKPIKRIFATVLNSDSLGGPGKHWTVVYIDLSKPQGTIEFFNSSGNPPYPEIIMWQAKAIRKIIECGVCTDVSFVPVSNIKHQHGPTECGVYSLYYIWSRLNGRSYDFFKKNEIRDDQVTVFRKTHLFINCGD